MRSGSLVLLGGISFIIVVDLLLFFLIRKHLKSKLSRFLYFGHSLFMIFAVIGYNFVIPRLNSPKLYYLIAEGIGFFMAVYFPKVLLIVLQVFSRFLGIFWKKSRMKLSKIAIFLSLCFFIYIIYCFTFGRSNYKVTEREIDYKSLPSTLDGFKIVHLSDLHLGSLNPSFNGMDKLVKLVNEQNADIVVISGDLVNNFASEIEPWIPQLQQMKAKYGKYICMGNHDYGDYSQWPSDLAKKQNLVDFAVNVGKTGFTLLNDTVSYIGVGDDTICIAGVQNWGKKMFARYGDLKKAMSRTNGFFTVLLSHDPSHWDAEIRRYNVPLTLSGHTHAMQMGINLGFWSWSPSKYMYEEYDGLYRKMDCFMNVSPGVGYVGFPGRIGLRPEVDVIKLKSFWY